MNFDHRRQNDELDINLIPLIDVLLVILIFLAASTSFTQTRQLPLSLPQAQASPMDADNALQLVISRDGQYALEDHIIDTTAPGALAQAIVQAARNHPDPALDIEADAQATHAVVVRALEAANQAHITRLRFITQSRP